MAFSVLSWSVWVWFFFTCGVPGWERVSPFTGLAGRFTGIGGVRDSSDSDSSDSDSDRSDNDRSKKYKYK